MSILRCNDCESVRDTDSYPEGFVVVDGSDAFLCENCLDGRVNLALAQIDRCDAAHEAQQYADDFYFTNGRAEVNRQTRAAHVAVLKGLGYE